jgi:hypothetical protein
MEGSEQEASLLALTAPSVKNRKPAAKLKQGFMRAINEIPQNTAKETKPDKDQKITPKDVLALVQMGSMDYGEYMDTFIALLTSGVCMVEGKEPMTAPIADKIRLEDMERLMGEYLINFIVGSLGE